jgi:hypothetical protein
MSLSSGKPALRQALRNFRDNTDPDKDTDEAIDEFLNVLEDWIKSATVTVPGTGLTAGNIPVTGNSITGNLS